MYSETIYTRADLNSAMDALDRLGKPYEVVKNIQEPDLKKNVPDKYWVIKEVSR